MEQNAHNIIEDRSIAVLYAAIFH